MNYNNKYIIVFEWSSVVLKTLDLNGNLYFEAMSVCKILDFSEPRKMVKALDDDEKTYLFHGEGQHRQRKLFLTESGLYHLIFVSRKPIAVSFRRWVTGTVLPSLRKNKAFGIGEMEEKVNKLIEENNRLKNMTADISFHNNLYRDFQRVSEQLGISVNAVILGIDGMYQEETGEQLRPLVNANFNGRGMKKIEKYISWFEWTNQTGMLRRMLDTYVEYWY